MNLDDRLASIERPVRDEARKQQFYRKAKAKQRVKLDSFVRSFVIVATLCIGFVFYMTSQIETNEMLKTAAFQGEGTIQEIQVLRNDKPENNLNASSPFYVLRNTTENPSDIKKMQEILLAAQADHVKWNKWLADAYSSYEIAVQYDEGRPLKLKVFWFNDYESVALVDIEANQMYFANDEQKLELTDLTSLGEGLHFSKLQIIGFILIVALIIVQTILERKRALPKEQRKRGWWIGRYFGGVIYLVLLYGLNKTGSIHIGYFIVVFIVLFTLGEWLDVRLGNKKPSSLLHLIFSIFLVILFIGILYL